MPRVPLVVPAATVSALVVAASVAPVRGVSSVVGSGSRDCLEEEAKDAEVPRKAAGASDSYSDDDLVHFFHFKLHLGDPDVRKCICWVEVGQEKRVSSVVKELSIEVEQRLVLKWRPSLFALVEMLAWVQELQRKHSWSLKHVMGFLGRSSVWGEWLGTNEIMLQALRVGDYPLVVELVLEVVATDASVLEFVRRCLDMAPTRTETISNFSERYFKMMDALIDAEWITTRLAVANYVALVQQYVTDECKPALAGRFDCLVESEGGVRVAISSLTPDQLVNVLSAPSGMGGKLLLRAADKGPKPPKAGKDSAKEESCLSAERSRAKAAKGDEKPDKPRYKFDGDCHLCGKYGHQQDQCPDKHKSGGDSDDLDKPPSCGCSPSPAPGHWGDRMEKEDMGKKEAVADKGAKKAPKKKTSREPVVHSRKGRPAQLSVRVRPPSRVVSWRPAGIRCLCSRVQWRSLCC